MPGRDWTCKKCEFKNFSRNENCKNCRSPKLDSVTPNEGNDGGGGSDGSWYCQNCDDRHPAQWIKCPLPVNPQAPKDQPPGFAQQQGDWNQNKNEGWGGNRGGASWGNQQGPGAWARPNWSERMSGGG